MQQVKVLVIGAAGSGKSELLKCLKYTPTHDYLFDGKYFPTIGVEVMPIRQNEIIFNFWDIAGQEKFAIARDLYYTGTQIILATYDMNCKASLKIVHKQIVEVKEKLGAAIPIILVGTKSDLRNEDIPAGLLVTSSKNGLGMDDVWKQLHLRV